MNPPTMKTVGYMKSFLLAYVLSGYIIKVNTRPERQHQKFVRREIGGKWILCRPVHVPIGHEYIPCNTPYGNDSFQHCPADTYQPDAVESTYNPLCINKWKNCESLEEIETFENCSVSSHPCFKDGRCSIKKGYCGTKCYHCQNIPQDCQKERVQQDCSCAAAPRHRSTISPKSVTSLPNVTTTYSTNNVTINSTQTAAENDLKVPVHVPTIEKDEVDADVQEKEEQLSEETIYAPVVIILLTAVGTVYVIAIVGGLYRLVVQPRRVIQPGSQNQSGGASTFTADQSIDDHAEADCFNMSEEQYVSDDDTANTSRVEDERNTPLVPRRQVAEVHPMPNQQLSVGSRATAEDVLYHPPVQRGENQPLDQHGMLEPFFHDLSGSSLFDSSSSSHTSQSNSQ